MVCLVSFALITLLAPRLHRLGDRPRVRHVPAEYPRIQTAIDSAQDGDTILVAPGHYYENINYRGKNLVIVSRFVLTHDVRDIARTIIDGSHPAYPDTASVVIITSQTNQRPVLEGFTITGGAGTVWLDARNGRRYREGGGILCEFASPRILHNIITRNAAVLPGGGSRSAGGGGIRCGNGSPVIAYNAITDNRGTYGAGVVLYYTAAEVRHNLIARNAGGDTFGGGALWFASALDERVPNVLDDNTIVDNRVVADTSGRPRDQIADESGRGGAILVYSGGVYRNAIVGRNNIIWGNVQHGARAIDGDTLALRLTTSDVQGGWPGAGNIAVDPMFADTVHYTLRSNSPAASRDAMGAYGERGEPLLP